MVKLHVDLDSSTSEPESSSLAEARQIQMRIANVANEGTTEPRLRQLIADGSAFLLTQPREMVSSASSKHSNVEHDTATASRTQDQP
jgi:hypothetical protein